jgi:ADP-ribosylglycohydrolase
MTTTTDTRLTLALRSLDGLSCGDAFATARGDLTLPVWPTTDDTEMACAIVEVLARHGTVNQDALARRFAERYAADPSRGYGPNAIAVLRDIGRGVPWKRASRRPVVGQASLWQRLKYAVGFADGPGSCGNGAAMRASVVGAWFGDRGLLEVAGQARKSAEVTHAHPDGIDGAIAVAVAAASMQEVGDPHQSLDDALGRVEPGPVRDGLNAARVLPAGITPAAAADILGRGEPITATATVPFALWCAARFAPDYEAAVRAAQSVGGDSDTLCAIVGGVVACHPGAVIPPAWLTKREPLRLDL